MSEELFKKWIDEAEECGLFRDAGTYGKSLSDIVWTDSIREKDNIIYFISRGPDREYLVSASDNGSKSVFYGAEISAAGKTFCFSCLNHENCEILRKQFPYTSPSRGGRNLYTFGTGDRLGIASTGHLRVFKKCDVVPVLAQQSLRELDLTGRTYTDIIDAASWAVFRSGYEGKWIADGDHLKHSSDVISALSQGCTMITADLSDHINYTFADMTGPKLLDAYRELDSSYRERIEKLYRGAVKISDRCSLDFSEENLASVALVYKGAVDHAENLFRACKSAEDDFDFEVSIDETETATNPEAHYFVASELKERGVDYSSIAPRFVGEFQKGIDYIGNLAEFEDCFAEHADIASSFGYKISVHSASDKFSAYPVIADNLKGAAHIKTSGTNWLCALKVIAELDPSLYRKLHTYSYRVFNTAKAYYHVTPDFTDINDIVLLKDRELYKIFANPNDRQVLHIAYGEILKVEEYRKGIYDILNANIEKYWDELESHIGRHLNLLGKL